MKRFISCLLFSLGCLASVLTAQEAPFRTWTSTSGHEIRAALEEARQSEAVLRKEDGQTLTVPLSSLVEKDREFVWDKLKKEDHFFNLRQKVLLRKEKTGKGAVPMFAEGPWAGATLVFEGRNYRYVLDGNFNGAFYPKQLSPGAVDIPFRCLSPSFKHRNPEATDKKERLWQDLEVAKITAGTTSLPAVLEGSLSREVEVQMDIEFENGRTGTLIYLFEQNAIRIKVRVPSHRHPQNVTSLIVSNIFPPSHEFTNEVKLPELKQRLDGWSVELKTIPGEETTRVAWWEGTKGSQATELKVDGPWEPWNFQFDRAKEETGRPIKFELYPGFAPYRKGFKVNRFANGEGDDLVLEWGMELTR